MTGAPELTLKALEASEMVSDVTFTALLRKLSAKGVLSGADGADVQEIYEDALYALEERQAEDPESGALYGVAREVLANELRGWRAGA